jgi:hypothetical protein
LYPKEKIKKRNVICIHKKICVLCSLFVHYFSPKRLGFIAKWRHCTCQGHWKLWFHTKMKIFSYVLISTRQKYTYTKFCKCKSQNMLGGQCNRKCKNLGMYKCIWFTFTQFHTTCKPIIYIYMHNIGLSQCCLIPCLFLRMEVLVLAKYKIFQTSSHALYWFYKFLIIHF